VDKKTLRRFFQTEHIDDIFDKDVTERDEFELSKNKQNELLGKLRKMGVYIASNKSILLSTLHTKEKVNFIKQCLESL